ncbi:hypothetical protein AURDEDRAFT_128807 [Auricularia subglabra TFB-10046 SS5]|nr:hypothetical protein AURDEDRAFT_128807 [Auricularia subglabra TFB-10046 SS5]
MSFKGQFIVDDVRFSGLFELLGTNMGRFRAFEFSDCSPLAHPCFLLPAPALEQLHIYHPPSLPEGLFGGLAARLRTLKLIRQYSVPPPSAVRNATHVSIGLRNLDCGLWLQNLFTYFPRLESLALNGVPKSMRHIIMLPVGPAPRTLSYVFIRTVAPWVNLAYCYRELWANPKALLVDINLYSSFPGFENPRAPDALADNVLEISVTRAEDLHPDLEVVLVGRCTLRVRDMLGRDGDSELTLGSCLTNSTAQTFPRLRTLQMTPRALSAFLRDRPRLPVLTSIIIYFYTARAEEDAGHFLAPISEVCAPQWSTLVITRFESTATSCAQDILTMIDPCLRAWAQCHHLHVTLEGFPSTTKIPDIDGVIVSSRIGAVEIPV